MGSHLLNGVFARRVILCGGIPLLTVLPGCAGELPVVGLDADGKEISTMVPRHTYVQRMAGGVDEMQQSVLPAMDGRAARQMMRLRELRLGLSVKGEVGLGELFKLAGNIGVRLGFTNIK